MNTLNFRFSIIFLLFSSLFISLKAQPPGPNVKAAPSMEKELQDTSINKTNAKGLKTGLWRERSGNMVNEGFYSDDLKQGTWKIYYPDGMVCTIEEYENGKRNGLCIDIKNNGYLRKQCYYKNDILNGRYKLYTQSGKPELETNYENGKLNGLKKVYYMNSRLQEEGNYVNDVRDGVTKWYYEDGKLSIEYNYKNGKLEGLQKTYFKDGSLNTETNYVNNNMEGEFREYFEGGKQIKITGLYKADKKTGIWKEMDNTGKVIKTEKYKDGVLAK